MKSSCAHPIYTEALSGYVVIVYISWVIQHIKDLVKLGIKYKLVK